MSKDTTNFIPTATISLEEYTSMRNYIASLEKELENAKKTNNDLLDVLHNFKITKEMVDCLDMNSVRAFLDFNADINKETYRIEFDVLNRK